MPSSLLYGILFLNINFAKGACEIRENIIPSSLLFGILFLNMNFAKGACEIRDF
jgi:hypothetical protein